MNKKTVPAIFNVDRPGDFYLQLSLMSGLISSGFFDGNNWRLWASNTSQFLDLRTLLKAHDNMTVELLNSKEILEQKQKENLYGSFTHFFRECSVTKKKQSLIKKFARLGPTLAKMYGFLSLRFNRHKVINATYDFEYMFNLISRYPVNPVTKKPESFYVFITLDIEKRRWLEQVAALTSAVELIKSKTNKSVVLVNHGMTQTINDKNQDYRAGQSQEEIKILNEICTVSGCEYINLFGSSLAEKLEYVHVCDLAVTTTYTGSMLPNAMSIPTISVGNYYLINTARKHGVLGINPNETVISKRDVREVEYQSSYVDKVYKTKSQLNSYSIPMDVFLSLVNKKLTVSS